MLRRTIPKSMSAWKGLALAILNRGGVHIWTMREGCRIHVATGLILAGHASSGFLCDWRSSILKSLHGLRLLVSNKRVHCRTSILNTAKRMRKNPWKSSCMIISIA